MDERVQDGLLKSYEGHWSKFKENFTKTFTDIAEGVKAEQSLQTLRMKNGDIDTYITTFKKLIKLAGYLESEHGTLKMFKEGLPNALNISIIRNTSPIPTTLATWIDAARDQQLKYLQTLEFSPKKGISPQILQAARRAGWNPNRNQNQNQQQRRDPNAMDVDAGNIRPQFTKLTDQERESLRASNSCF